MSTKYIIVAFGHLVAVSIVIKILQWVLPCCVSQYYTCAAECVLGLLVAMGTFGLSRKKFLADKILADNRAVLITGCDTGFGNGLAKRLDTLGFHVFASCLFPDGPGAEDLRKSCSKRLQVLGLDVTRDDSVKAALECVKENLGTSELWAIVNNAGIIKGFSVEISSLQSFKDTMEVNTFGVVRVTKAFLPLLRQSRGRIINLSSLAGRIHNGYNTSYTMSKSATVAFSECLRQEMMVWGVRVISVEPEFFQTNMTSPENIGKLMDATVSELDEDIKSDYGEKYFRLLKSNFELTVNLSSQNISKVWNALELAITLKNPATVYQPCRHFGATVTYKLLEHMPNTLRGFLHVYVFLYATGVPIPKEAANN